jgi:kinesin family protein C2/C3
MEEIQFNTFHQNPETLGPDSSVSRAFDWEKVEPLNQEPEDSAMNDEGDESLVDSMLCDSRSRLIPSGYTRSNSTG